MIDALAFGNDVGTVGAAVTACLPPSTKALAMYETLFPSASMRQNASESSEEL
jgi:hypothetical protein